MRTRTGPPQAGRFHIGRLPAGVYEGGITAQDVIPYTPHTPDLNQ